MIETVALIAAIIAVTFIGYNVFCLLAGRSVGLGIPETLSVSYALGFGCISLEMLLFYCVGWRFTVSGILSLWLPVLVVNALRYIRYRRSRPVYSPAEAPSKRLSPIEMFLVAGITFETAYAFFRALIKPIESYDAIAIYAIRSKIFYLAGAITGDYFSSIGRAFPHADYPLNIQLSETFLYMSMGGINEQLVKVIFPMFFASILCMLYFALRRFASRVYALAFTFVLAGIPHFNNYATNAYLEVPLAFYIFAGGLFLLRWFESGDKPGYAVLSAVMVALAGWTKNEGLMYCAIFTAIVFLHALFRPVRFSKKDILYAFLYLGIILLISLPWTLVKAHWHIANDEIALSNMNPVNLFKQLHKIGPIFYEFQKQIFGPKKWNIFWPVVMFVLLFNYKRIFKGPQAYLALTIFMALCGYVLFYMISYVDVTFFASKTWARFLLDPLPLVVYMAALILKEDVKC